MKNGAFIFNNLITLVPGTKTNGAIIIKILNKNIIPSICSGDNSKSQFLFIIDGALVNAAVVITNGVFLSGYIVLLNGSDFLVGILNNTLNWAAIAAISSFLIFEHMQKRKKLLITTNIISRVMICSIVFIPLITRNNAYTLPIVTSMVVIGNIIWGFYNIGITVMMIELIPQKSRSQYIYVRMFWLRISFTITTISMGFILDFFNKSYTGFLIVFITSLVLSAADVLILSNVQEPIYTIDKETGFNKSNFFEPLKNKKYRNFLMFIFFFYLSLTISTSFTPLYLIKYLNFDYGFISTTNVITYILMIVCTKFWQRIEQKNGLPFVLKLTAVFVAFEVFIYSFLTNNTYYLLYLAPIVSGIGYSGFNISVFTYRYELIPEKNRTIYEGWFGAVFGLSMLISPVIGTIVMKHLPIINNFIYKFSSFQLIYLVSFICSIVVILLVFCRPKNLKSHISKINSTH